MLLSRIESKMKSYPVGIVLPWFNASTLLGLKQSRAEGRDGRRRLFRRRCVGAVDGVEQLRGVAVDRLEGLCPLSVAARARRRRVVKTAMHDRYEFARERVLRAQGRGRDGDARIQRDVQRLT